MSGRYNDIDFDFGMPSRFDLEDAIIKQMDVIDNLNTLIENALEGDNSCSDPDYLVNTLQGIINLHEMKYAKLWAIFIALFRLDEHVGSMYNESTEETDEESEVDY